MGCDIHSRVEVKENGVWKLNTEEVFENQYYYSPEKIKEYIDPMRKLAEKYEDVRLVFGFDN
jgi:hypothetical protein